MFLYLPKRTVFTRWKIVKRGRCFIFPLDYCHKIVLYKVLYRNISEIFKTKLKFIINFFHCKFYQKNQVHSSYSARSNKFYKRVIILPLDIWMWNLSLIWFLRIHLVQEYCNIVKIKSTFVVNRVIWKT